MTQTEEKEEQTLSYVQLSDDSKAILLNGNREHSLSLPSTFSRKSEENQRKIVESLIYNGCVSFNYDYKGQDNVRNHAREVVNYYLERKRAKKEEDQKTDLKKQYIQKFFQKETGVLYESVIIAGKPYFVFQQRGQARFFDRLPVPDATNPTMELLPPERDGYLSKPFEFASEGELNEYLKIAGKETLDSLYKTQKALASKYIDAGDTHLTILAADDIFTFFQDKLGQCHYLMFVGDNDTGKSTSLVYFQYEGYRAMLDVDITPANIYGFLGNFEEAQGIILEDEADDIHKRPEKMKIYKSGYNAGKKVTRTDISNFGRKTTGWNTYCFKAFTSEEAPDNNAAKGFMDCTFVIHCASGRPAYDIQEITNPAGDEGHTELLDELLHHRKILFAYRLLHFQDPIPNIELSVRNREKQLCKPVLRLFQDSECQEEIGGALADLVGQKRGLKRGTLESKILDSVIAMITENVKQEEERGQAQARGEWTFKGLESNQIPITVLIDRVRGSLDGEYRHDKDKSFQTDDHGSVSHDRIRSICVDKFGAEAKRNNSIRYLEFNLENLNKAIESYTFPEKVTILQKNVSESGSDGGDADQSFSTGANECDHEGKGADHEGNHEGTQ